MNAICCWIRQCQQLGMFAQFLSRLLSEELVLQAGQRYLTSINSAAVAPTTLEITRADPVQQGDLVNTTRTHGL